MCLRGQPRTSISEYLIIKPAAILPYYHFPSVSSHLASSHSFGKKSKRLLNSLLPLKPVPRCYIRALHLATTSNLPSAHAPASAVSGDRVASWEVQSSHPECWCPPGGWVIGSPDVCRAAGWVCDSVCLLSAAASDLQTSAIIHTPGAHTHFSYHHYCFKAKV